jgi:hypothetical protein
VTAGLCWWLSDSRRGGVAGGQPLS